MKIYHRTAQFSDKVLILKTTGGSQYFWNNGNNEVFIKRIWKAKQ